MNPLQNAEFLLAAPDPRQLPPDTGAEVAFAGRSNAGKSSALNALVGRRALARTSRTPGRTRLLMVFTLDEMRRLVDLPGYGYAKAPLALRAQWERAISRYLEARRSLRALVLVMDVRHPLKDTDRQLLAFCAAIGLPCLCLLTKADKLSRSRAATQLAQVRRELAAAGWHAEVQLFSAQDRTGVEAARARIAALLAADEGSGPEAE